MLPDTIPSPKAAEAFETHLRQLELADPPASLDARMQALLAAPAVAASRPARAFWKKPAPWAALAGLAACAALALLLRPQTDTPARPAPHAAPVAIAAQPAEAQMTPSATPPSVFEGAVPVGYQYQGSRTLYAEEIPVGTLRSATPQQAYQRRVMLRHTFQDPRTHALYEVDAPQEELVLENLHSY